MQTMQAKMRKMERELAEQQALTKAQAKEILEKKDELKRLRDLRISPRR